MPDEIVEKDDDKGEDEEVSTEALFAEFADKADKSGDSEIVASSEPKDGEEKDPEAAASGDDSSADAGEKVGTPAADADEKSVTEETLKAENEEQKRTIENLTHTIKSNEGRVSKIQRQLNALQKEQETGHASPKEFAKAFTSEAGWKEFKEENPELAGQMENFIGGLAEVTDRNLEKTNKKTDQLSEVAAEDSDAKISAIITEVHPDWLDWIVSPEYSSWLSKQPAAVQAIQEDGEVEDSIALLDMYKTHLIASGSLKTTSKKEVDQPSKEADAPSEVAQIKEKRDRQLQDGVQPPAAGGSAKPISDKDTSSLFDHFVSLKEAG